jgi:hypothetical protein
MTYGRRFGTLITLSLAAVCAVLTPTRAQAACDATTIGGNYGFRLHELVSGPTPQSSAGLSLGQFAWGAFVGRMVFAPTTGTVTGFRSGNEGGVPLTNSFTSQSTYSVNPDCSGTLTLGLDDGTTRVYEIAIVQGGAEIQLTEISGSSLAVVADGFAKKQPTTCDAKTIAGDFGLRFNRLLAPSATDTTSALGSFIPSDVVDFIHFDPTTSPPSVSGYVIGIFGGTVGFEAPIIEPESYSVSPNCTGTLTFTNLGGQTKTIAMSIVEDAAGIEIEFAIVSVATGSPQVGEGVGKKQ